MMRIGKVLGYDKTKSNVYRAAEKLYIARYSSLAKDGEETVMEDDHVYRFKLKKKSSP